MQEEAGGGEKRSSPKATPAEVYFIDEEEDEESDLLSASASSTKNYKNPLSVLRPNNLKPFDYDGAPISISWDCGSKNLAYNLLAYNWWKPGREASMDEVEIIGWEKIDLLQTEMAPITQALHEELNKRPWLKKINYCNIEQQMPQHLKMFAFSFALMMYFLEIGKDSNVVVELISAQEKYEVLKLNDEEMELVKARTKRNDAYSIRKEQSVFQCEKVLSGYEDLRPLAYLRQYDKKDDLAESFNQNLVFMRKKMRLKQQAKRARQIIELNAEENNRTHSRTLEKARKR